MRNLIITAEAVAKSALLREESRGAHTRVDFPGEREEGLEYNIVVSKQTDGLMKTEKVHRPKGDEELMRIAHSTIDELEQEVSSERSK